MNPGKHRPHLHNRRVPGAGCKRLKIWMNVLLSDYYRNVALGLQLVSGHGYKQHSSVNLVYSISVSTSLPLDRTVNLRYCCGLDDAFNSRLSVHISKLGDRLMQPGKAE